MLGVHNPRSACQPSLELVYGVVQPCTSYTFQGKVFEGIYLKKWLQHKVVACMPVRLIQPQALQVKQANDPGTPSAAAIAILRILSARQYEASE